MVLTVADHGKEKTTAALPTGGAPDLSIAILTYPVFAA